jgi:hypothetical protein
VRFKPLFLALLVGTVACEQILNLDKYEKCDAMVCDASIDGDLDANADASDASSDAVVIPDAASEASSWARWRMENTQTEVKNGATDASLSSFADGGTILQDGVTKLVWKTQLGIAASVDDAAKFCASIGGRLPTRVEMATLLDSTRPGKPYITPAFDAIVTPDAGPPPPALWTSSYHRPLDTPIHFWFADLSTGDMLQTTQTLGTGVLCIQ